MLDTNERPTVQEQYEVAGNTSNLRVEAEKHGAGDVMIAGGYASGVDAHGMSPTRLGMALLRMHSEWSSAAKPNRLTARQIEALAASLKAQDEAERANGERENGELARLEILLERLEPESPDRFDLLVAVMKQRKLYESGALPVRRPVRGKPADRAYAQAAAWYTNELRILANSLKSRATVWEGLAPWARSNRIPDEKAAEGLLYWLAPTCGVCDGHGLRKVPNAPALSARQCHKCQGTGNTPHPEGTGRVLGHLDYCLGLARGSLKARLRNKR